MLRALAVFIGAVVLIVAAGVSGALFWVWPTFFPDAQIKCTSVEIAHLKELQAERKFVEDRRRFYFGASSEETRAAAQASVDRVIEQLLRDLPSNPKRSVVLGIFKQSLSNLGTSESEERDEYLHYLERIMDILGVQSSGQLLTVWRYGFPYGWLV